MSALRCNDVSLFRGGVHALKGVTVEVEPGEVVGLIGPNGAGKTSLLDVLSGFLAPYSGSVALGGENITTANAVRRARMGLHRTFQGARLFGGLTVSENVQVAALSVGMPAKDADDIARDLLHALGLAELGSTRCSSLPQGVVQRIVLARALATKPKFLLLDEPAAGLSEAETSEFEDLLARTRSDGAGILVVEHDMRFVERTCSRAYVLAEGSMLFEGTVEETFSSAEVQAAYLGNADLATHGR